jgi:hypothetical protein
MLDNLITEWQTWCANNNFPQSSADELFLELKLTDEQKSYVEDFIKRWDQAEEMM